MEDGVYYAGWAIGPGVHVVLKPGLYVFAGGGIQMNSDEQMSAIGDVDAGGDPIEARVTIFSTEHTAGCQAGTQNFCQGDIRVNTNQFGSLQLTATNASTCQQVSPTICTWKGILLWQDDTVLGAAKPITITAQSTLYLAGTIYAPESRVDIAGGANGTGCRDEPPDPKTCLAIQIISRQWSISGGGDIDMPYDPDELYQLEQQGLVH
jgi:hypothetical protein